MKNEGTMSSCGAAGDRSKNDGSFISCYVVRNPHNLSLGRCAPCGCGLYIWFAVRESPGTRDCIGCPFDHVRAGAGWIQYRPTSV